MKRIIIFIFAILGMVVSIFAQNSWTSGTGVLYTNPNTTKVGIGISNPETLLHINKMNELQIQLLQKVEELPLYIIQQELRILDMETQIAK